MGDILTPSYEAPTYQSPAYKKIIVEKPKKSHADLETEVDVDSDTTESINEKINIPRNYMVKDMPKSSNTAPSEGRSRHPKWAAASKLMPPPANITVAKPQSKKVECYDDDDVDDDWEFSQMHLM
jgi:hypothetical protein